MESVPSAQTPPVTAIGFGGMSLSIEGRLNEAVAIRVVHSVLDAGVILIDTADDYIFPSFRVDDLDCVYAM